jgi:cysteine desulfurase
MELTSRIYLDNAATTPLAKEVAEVMCHMLNEDFGNPSSIHAHGRVTRTKIEEARRSVAKLLGCTPGEIIFTSGGTEADNMALRMSVEVLGVKNIITSAIEHHAVLHTAEELHKQGKVNLHLVNLLPNGHIDLQHLEQLLKDHNHALVSLMHANNEIGNMIDLEVVGNLCKQYNALFHTDTVQTIGHFAFDLSKLNIDFLAAGAHKFNGPKGVGFIYINAKNKITPYITGGAQERNMRGGTENVYGIVGLAKALELSYANLEEEHKHIGELKTYMGNRLKETISGITFNGDYNGHSSYTVLNASFPPNKVNEMLLFKLDIAGISVSGGSACSSGSDVGSHVLTALGTDPARAAVRFSFGKQNTKQEIDQVIAVLQEIFIPAKQNQ